MWLNEKKDRYRVYDISYGFFLFYFYQFCPQMFVLALFGAHACAVASAPAHSTFLPKRSSCKACGFKELSPALALREHLRKRMEQQVRPSSCGNFFIILHRSTGPSCVQVVGGVCATAWQHTSRVTHTIVRPSGAVCWR